MYIVQGKQAQAEYLVGDVKMPDVGAGEPRARRAVARLVDWLGVVAEFGSLDVETAVGGKSSPVSPHSGWRDAIEKVNPAQDSFDDVFGEADTHQVAGPVSRESIVYHIEHLVHRRLLFAD